MIQLATESTLISAPPPFFLEDRRERSRHAQRAEEIHLELLARVLDRAIGEEAAQPRNAGIVDQQGHVGGLARGGGDIFVARDVELQRDDTRQRDGARVARSRVDFRRAGLQQGAGESEAEAPVGAGDQRFGS